MSGFYNNWYKVQNPSSPNDITPMESGGFQPPFFFGGSQVPSALKLSTNEIKGTGIKGYKKINFLPQVKGKGVQSTQNNKHSNIFIPRHMGSLKKPI